METNHRHTGDCCVTDAVEIGNGVVTENIGISYEQNAAFENCYAPRQG